MNRLMLVIFGASAILLSLLGIANAIYFHYRYQRKLDSELMKSEYYSGGLIVDLMRLMLYGHYCLFPKRAKRDDVSHVFNKISKTERIHLVFHWCSVIGSITLYCLAYFIGRMTY